ncbi:hypothetical protein [Streptomyces sp. NPDC091299]|uniref:DUF6197 family protein n=1 Tax=Streptomyces sp. NPDC091299 TaxID=3155302 RepID=UPI003419D111
MRAPTETITAAPVELDFDARLVEVGLVMDARLSLANLSFEVDTAHIESADPIPEVVAPPRLVPTIAPCPYPTSIAATLHQARVRLETDGWCAGQLREGEQRCLIGVIRAVAGSRREADDARDVLDEAIRRDFRIRSIPEWNDQQRDARLPLLYLDRAASLAHSRGL